MGATSRGLRLQLSALVIRLRLPHLRYARFASSGCPHFAAMRLSESSIKIHQLHVHPNSLGENHFNLDHHWERTPSDFRSMGALGGRCDWRPVSQ